eukprot:2943475-Pleurochrysis_carterae.AAC.3
MGTAVIGAHAAVFTAPVWHERVRPRPGLIRTFASSYGGKTITDFIHGWAYFNLMGQLGATSMSVMKAAVAASRNAPLHAISSVQPQARTDSCSGCKAVAAARGFLCLCGCLCRSSVGSRFLRDKSFRIHDRRRSHASFRF